jgi:hypothetical protein
MACSDFPTVSNKFVVSKYKRMLCSILKTWGKALFSFEADCSFQIDFPVLQLSLRTCLYFGARKSNSTIFVNDNAISTQWHKVHCGYEFESDILFHDNSGYKIYF